MATFTNDTKHTANFSGVTKNTADYGALNQVKAGLGWLYNQVGITYNGATDLISGNKVYYNGVGTVTVWSNENES